MLQAAKVQALTNFHVTGTTIRLKELDFLLKSLERMTTVATLLAGFVFADVAAPASALTPALVLLQEVDFCCLMFVVLLSLITTVMAPRSALQSLHPKAIDDCISRVETLFRIVSCAFDLGIGGFILSVSVTTVVRLPLWLSVASLGVLFPTTLTLWREYWTCLAVLEPYSISSSRMNIDPLGRRMPSRILIPPVVRLLCHTLPVGCALSVAKICEGHTREVAEEAIRTVCDVRKQCWECQQPIDAPFVSRDSPIIPVESDDDGFSDLYLENESSVVSKSSTEQEQFEKRLEIAERVPSVVFETSDPPGLFCGECAERFRLPSEMDESDMLLLSRLTTDWDEYQNALDPHSRSSLYCRLVSVDEASCKVAPMPVLFAHGKRVVDMDVFRPLSKNYLTTMDQLTAAARENLPQIIDMALGVGFWQYFAALCFPPHQVSKDADLNIVNRAVALKIAAPVRALEARVASVSALKCIISSILFELGLHSVV
ncbi:MAG: hypothetical protein KVP17_001493 [Porospora cf. gigantea B]|uniref:uncharacterized protein n=1 Tax=Porospora cf. gigantea B TaxID=2853592 RepID=UPI003571F375|nr:MAG: hypothetical protein KVP17_001493 [Porospora cf. gigantea B]